MLAIAGMRYHHCTSLHRQDVMICGTSVWCSPLCSGFLLQMGSAVSFDSFLLSLRACFASSVDAC